MTRLQYLSTASARDHLPQLVRLLLLLAQLNSLQRVTLVACAKTRPDSDLHGSPATSSGNRTPFYPLFLFFDRDADGVLSIDELVDGLFALLCSGDKNLSRVAGGGVSPSREERSVSPSLEGRSSHPGAGPIVRVRDTTPSSSDNERFFQAGVGRGGVPASIWDLRWKLSSLVENLDTGARGTVSWNEWLVLDML